MKVGTAYHIGNEKVPLFAFSGSNQFYQYQKKRLSKHDDLTVEGGFSEGVYIEKKDRERDYEMVYRFEDEEGRDAIEVITTFPEEELDKLRSSVQGLENVFVRQREVYPMFKD